MSPPLPTPFHTAHNIRKWKEATITHHSSKNHLILFKKGIKRWEGSQKRWGERGDALQPRSGAARGIQLPWLAHTWPAWLPSVQPLTREHAEQSEADSKVAQQVELAAQLL